MKKFAISTAIILVMAMLLGVLSGCNTTEKYFNKVYSSQENLAKGATYYNQDLKKTNAFTITKNKKLNHVATVDLGSEKEFNTITLSESTKSVTKFTIYASNSLDDGYKFIYQGDTISTGRTCFVGDMKYRYLRMFVTEWDGNFKVNDINVYNIHNAKSNDLRVNAYLVANAYDENFNFSMLDGVTDIIFFGMAKLTSSGDIEYHDNGQVTAVEYKKQLQILKDAIGERDINIIVDIGLPYSEGNADIQTMMSTNKDKTIQNIKNFINEHGFDGYDIDYEYPNSNKQWKTFNTFLRALGKAIPDKILSIATAGWALKFDKDVIDRIDRVELMTYDGFDHHGYQSTFEYTVDQVNKALKAGFKKEQIEIGIPYYSRPVNGHEYWGTYADFAEQMGKYNNLVDYNGFDHDGKPMSSKQYLNCVQLVADKTAFAIDAGLGGVMIFRLTLDMPYESELSLTKAMKDTKTAKMPA